MLQVLLLNAGYEMASCWAIMFGMGWVSFHDTGSARRVLEAIEDSFPKENSTNINCSRNLLVTVNFAGTRKSERYRYVFCVLCSVFCVLLDAGWQ